MTPAERATANVQNRAIVQHLISCQATGKPYCTTNELLECFGPNNPTEEEALRFRRKLNHLGSKDAIENLAPTGKPDRWAPGPRAQAFCHTASGRTEMSVDANAEPVPKWVGPIVPPRRVDVMNGPVYVPTHAASNRAGVDDFRHCRSVGVRC